MKDITHKIAPSFSDYGVRGLIAQCEERPGSHDCRDVNVTSLPLTATVAIIGVLCWTWPWIMRRLRRRRNGR